MGAKRDCAEDLGRAGGDRKWKREEWTSIFNRWMRQVGVMSACD